MELRDTDRHRVASARRKKMKSTRVLFEPVVKGAEGQERGRGPWFEWIGIVR